MSSTTPDSLSYSGQEEMFRAISCAVSSKSATYISGPITTGLNFVNWYADKLKRNIPNEINYRDALRNNVIRPNEIKILELAEHWRSTQRGTVIEPASLYIEAWSQDDFIKFWLGVLDRFVRTVVLVEGWQYSAGCVAEYNFSRSHGHLILSHFGEPIDRAAAVQLINAAAFEVEKKSNGDEVLLRLAQNLRANIDQES